MTKPKAYSTAEVAKKLGISKSILLRWFRIGKVKDVGRDSKGWRIFTEEDVERIKEQKGRPSRANIRLGMEKRSYMRMARPMPLTYFFMDRKTVSKEAYKGETIDVSGGGVSFKSQTSMPPETLLRVEIDLPPKTIKAVGQVRWVQEKKDEKTGYLVGSKFINIAEPDRNFLIQKLFV